MTSLVLVSVGGGLLPVALALALGERWAAADLGPWAVVVLVGFAPIVEECFFRGPVHARLARHLRGSLVPGVTRANAATAVAFGAAHVLPVLDVTRFAVALPALVFGAWYERGGRHGAPVLVHAAYNTVLLCSWRL